MAVARDRLFELAVNRAAQALDRLGPRDPDARRRALEVWYLKTRFASRVPFASVAAALASRPDGDVHWRGGPDGGWEPGAPSTP